MKRFVLSLAQVKYQHSLNSRRTEPRWPLGVLRKRLRLGPSSERFVDGNSVTLLRDGAATYAAMLSAIDAARSHVWLEMYWFSDDVVGQRFFEALKRAASRGVHVLLIYDAVGSFGTDTAHFEALREAGVPVVEFNPVSPLQMRFHTSRLTVRNHRKLLIADAEAFVGGQNICLESLPREQGGQAWRDDVLSVRGPVLSALCESFVATWKEGSGLELAAPKFSFEVCGDVQVAVLDQSGRERRQALDAYLRRLWQAQQRILIANAYFLPNRRLRRALVAAARRGVEVHIMLPGQSDVPAVRHASRAIWGPLLQSGVRIYEWQPSVLHSKSAVIDTQWTTVGSFNLDYISVRSNRELNLSVLDEQLAERLERTFVADLAQCQEVQLAQYRKRPWLARGLERVLYWFRAWL